MSARRYRRKKAPLKSIAQQVNKYTLPLPPLVIQDPLPVLFGSPRKDAREDPKRLGTALGPVQNLLQLLRISAFEVVVPPEKA